LDRFGYVLRKWRKRRGLSLARLGARVNVSGGLIQLTEVADRHPTYDLAQRCETVLDAGGEILEAWKSFAEPYDTASLSRMSRAIQDGNTEDSTKILSESPEREGGALAGEEFPGSSFASAFRYLAERDDEDIMRRRAFLLDLAALAAIAQSDPSGGLEAMRRELTGAVAEERAFADVNEWHEIASEYGEVYLTIPPSDLLASLRRDFLGLHMALSRVTDPAVKRELAAVAATLAVFTARTVGNLGHTQEEWRWWRTARAAAHGSGDKNCELWVRAREVITRKDRDPIGRVLRLAEEAEGVAGENPPELLLAAKAEALALSNGRERDAESALHQLRQRSGTSPSAGYSGSLLAWGEEQLRNAETFVYSRLGDLNSTDKARRAALAFYVPSRNIRWSTENELHLAVCLVKNGDLTEGLSHAQSAITKLPAPHRTQTILNHGRDVLNAVPEKHREQPDAQDYRDWLNAAANIPATLPPPTG
jgi:transcriptional regulator with XRE-family HTH domain